MSQRAARVHKWIGVTLLVPLLVWSATGLLFALKPGWGPAYEYLSPWTNEARNATPLRLAKLASVVGEEDMQAIELVQSAAGPLYKVRTETEARLYDGVSGQRIDPIDEERARAIVENAVSRSLEPSRYGTIESLETQDSSLTFHFSGGPQVAMDRTTGSLRQKGPDTDRINWFYKLHYMQWTGNAGVDRVLGFTSIVFVFLLAGLGLWLTRKRTWSPP